MARSRSVWLSMTAAAATSFDGDGAAQATYTYTGPSGVAVRQVEIELPPGSQGTLHLIPYVVGRAGARVSAVQFAKGGDQFASGDNTRLRLDCDLPLNTGDEIQAWYDNTDATNPHWFAMIVTIA